MNDRQTMTPSEKLVDLDLPTFLPAFGAFYILVNAAKEALDKLDRARVQISRYTTREHSDFGMVIRDVGPEILLQSKVFETCFAACRYLSGSNHEPEEQSIEWISDMIGDGNDALSEDYDLLYTDSPLGAAVAVEAQRGVNKARGILNAARSVARVVNDSLGGDGDPKVATDFEALRATL